MFCAPLLLLPLSLFALSTADSDRAVAPLPGAFVSLAEGRMTVVTDAGIQGYMGLLDDTPLAPRGMLEVAATGDAELSWTGRGSLTARGSATIGWEGSPFDSEPLRLPEFTEVQLEARSGELAVLLPGGVLLVAERCVVELKQRSSGIFGVHQVAGDPLVVVVPAPGAPEVRELTTGQWLWIDPMDYLGRSRFAFPGPDPVEEQQVFAAAKQGSMGFRRPLVAFASGDQPWGTDAPFIAGGWPASPAVAQPLAEPFAFDGIGPPQVRIAPFVLDEPAVPREKLFTPVVVAPFDLGPVEDQPATPALEADLPSNVDLEPNPAQAQEADDAAPASAQPRVEDLLEAGDSLLDALLRGELPVAETPAQTPPASQAPPWVPENALEPVESPLHLEAWEPILPPTPRTDLTKDWVHPEGWRGFPYRLPDQPGLSRLLADPVVAPVELEVEAPALGNDPAQLPSEQALPTSEEEPTEGGLLDFEDQVGLLFDRATSQRSLGMLRAAGARLDAAFRTRRSLSALFEKSTRRDS